MSYRAAVFVINNYSDEEIWQLDHVFHKGTFSYIVYGKEVGESKTPHLQGYCEFRKKKRFEAVKHAIGKRAYIAHRRGTQEQAIKYCKKDGDFVELGTPRAQGQRSDLDGARLLAIEEGMRAVVRGGSLQQINVAKIFLTYAEEGRDWKPYVYWIHGPSGIGKSRKARELAEGEDTYTLPIPPDGEKIWWDGYDGHETVIIDDASPTWLSFKTLLQYLDRYELRVPNKGSFRQLLPKTIILTSISSPDREYFDPNGELIRRISEVIDLTVPEVGGNITTPTPESDPDEEAAEGDMSD